MARRKEWAWAFEEMKDAAEAGQMAEDTPTQYGYVLSSCTLA